MSFSIADLPILKWSLGAFVLSIVLSAGIISLSNSYLETSLKGRQIAQQQVFDTRAQLLAAQSDEENMSAYAFEYNSLQGQKVIGDEQRLDWIEGLEKLRQQGSVLDFKYTISPQKSHRPTPRLMSNFILSRSSMSMQIDLLHEEQLLHLFADMHSKLNGWFMLDGSHFPEP